MSEPSRIEQLASANAKPADLDPMAAWDRAVAARMDHDHCSRSAAVDRLLATPGGSSMWNSANQWWAAQPHVVIENGREIRSGNWGNNGPSSLRRVPRQP